MGLCLKPQSCLHRLWRSFAAKLFHFTWSDASWCFLIRQLLLQFRLRLWSQPCQFFRAGFSFVQGKTWGCTKCLIWALYWAFHTHILRAHSLFSKLFCRACVLCVLWSDVRWLEQHQTRALTFGGSIARNEFACLEFQALFAHPSSRFWQASWPLFGAASEVGFAWQEFYRMSLRLPVYPGPYLRLRTQIPHFHSMRFIAVNSHLPFWCWCENLSS